MLSASTFSEISLPLVQVFNGLRKSKTTKYPMNRLCKFIETISRDVHQQLIKIIGPRRLLHLPVAECEAIILEAEKVFEVWETESQKITTMIRQGPKQKREDIKVASRINFQHLQLRKRLEDIKKFRKQHEQLRSVITRVLRRPHNDGKGENKFEHRLAEADTFSQMENAYNSVKEIDYLDVSRDGEAIWVATLKRYTEQISRTENELASKLRDQLGGAKNANEMFSIFSRFNALLVRPHIRSG